MGVQRLKSFHSGRVRIVNQQTTWSYGEVRSTLVSHCWTISCNVSHSKCVSMAVKLRCKVSAYLLKTLHDIFWGQSQSWRSILKPRPHEKVTWMSLIVGWCLVLMLGCELLVIFLMRGQDLSVFWVRCWAIPCSHFVSEPHQNSVWGVFEHYLMYFGCQCVILYAFFDSCVDMLLAYSLGSVVLNFDMSHAIWWFEQRFCLWFTFYCIFSVSLCHHLRRLFPHMPLNKPKYRRADFGGMPRQRTHWCTWGPEKLLVWCSNVFIVLSERCVMCGCPQLHVCLSFTVLWLAMKIVT